MSPCSCQMKLNVSSNDCWLQEWDAFSNTLVWIIHICRYNEAHENSNIYIWKYMYSIYFKHVYFFITSSVMSKLFLIQSTTIVCLCVCVCLSVCVFGNMSTWKHYVRVSTMSGMSSASDILFHNVSKWKWMNFFLFTEPGSSLSHSQELVMYPLSSETDVTSCSLIEVCWFIRNVLPPSSGRWWRQHISEDSCLHSNCHENIKSHSMAANEMCWML